VARAKTAENTESFHGVPFDVSTCIGRLYTPKRGQGTASRHIMMENKAEMFCLLFSARERETAHLKFKRKQEDTQRLKTKNRTQGEQPGKAALSSIFLSSFLSRPWGLLHHASRHLT
jgi:hypothetical protein